MYKIITYLYGGEVILRDEIETLEDAESIVNNLKQNDCELNLVIEEDII